MTLAVDRTQIVLRAGLFSLASNAAVLFVLKFGLLLWPDRLPANSQNIFWLASGVNVAGLLILGLRYWPVLLLNAIPAWLLAGEPLDMCVVGAAANAIEALGAAWLIRQAGRFTERFDTVRAVGGLVAASFAAPLVNTLIFPAWLCAKGVFPWTEYGRALGNWNLSNGAAMLMLAPLLVAWVRRDWSAGPRRLERWAVGAAAGALSFLGFDAMFQGAGMNFGFLAFPVVIYASVRFGIGETAAVLGVVLVSIYASLLLHAAAQPPLPMAATIWFVQALCWVLAATGLLVAVLGAERRRIERASLEASLAAESARLAALRYQVNPHFLFNALNSIRAALPLSEAAPREMLTDLAGFLRSTLDGGENEQASLRDEIRSVQEYLRIEQRRFGERLQVAFVIDPAAVEKFVPAFLLQPLVENAIRHGLEEIPEPCQVEISARLDGPRLHLLVANTGRWRDPGPRQGIGLANIRRRLHLLHGSAASLQVGESDGFVRILIGIPT